VRLKPDKLFIGDDELKPEEVPYLSVETDQITVPREAMGLGDVKFMAAIGAFLGWQAIFFILMVSSVIGAFVGISMILFQKYVFKKDAVSTQIPYGPYIALAAAMWIFGGFYFWQRFWSGRM
jgi:leader peptidase (prepilin peptidase)/N-methyltransferase